MDLHAINLGLPAIYLEGYSYGLYSGIFFMYLQCHNTKNLLFYALCVLYLLSMVNLGLDIAAAITNLGYETSTVVDEWIEPLVFACCDFIAQCILIYRCWIVWARNIRVVIIPLIVALAFFALWIAGLVYYDKIYIHPSWDLSYKLLTTSLVTSMTVNALVTGLIVFKIFKVFREINRYTTSNEKSLGATGEKRLLSIMLVIIESGMALFCIQVARLVVTIIVTDATDIAFSFISPIHQVLTGITPTIILVRVSMGLSFNDQGTMVEHAGNYLRFCADDPNSISETGTQERERYDFSGSDDILMVERQPHTPSMYEQ